MRTTEPGAEVNGKGVRNKGAKSVEEENSWLRMFPKQAVELQREMRKPKTSIEIFREKFLKIRSLFPSAFRGDADAARAQLVSWGFQYVGPDKEERGLAHWLMPKNGRWWKVPGADNRGIDLIEIINLQRTVRGTIHLLSGKNINEFQFELFETEEE